MYRKELDIFVWILLIYIGVTVTIRCIILKGMDENANAAMERDDRIMVACGYVFGNE